MSHRVISLDPSTPGAHTRALDEVREFHRTDMGQGDGASWTFRLLQEPDLSTELRQCSNPVRQGLADGVSIQPGPVANEDRICMREWKMPNGVWQFTAIFDGHSSSHTVDYVLSELPTAVESSLRDSIESRRPVDPRTILSRSIIDIDEQIRTACARLFPPGAVLRGSDVAVEQVLKERKNRRIVQRCTSGATVLISLSDPGRRNVWVANLGDSMAVCCTRRPSSQQWVGRLVNSLHNAQQEDEILRLRYDHPGEDYCVHNNRVLGFLEPTRSIGDTWLKMPSDYTTRIFSQLEKHEWMSPDKAKGFAKLIRSPPYVSCEPEIYHLKKPHSNASMILILCSDGLADLYTEMDMGSMLQCWANVVGAAIDARLPLPALSLLRHSLGGDDVLALSRSLTLEMDEKWMDDVSIIVHRL